ncbi:MAG: hypothetical protein DGJ47_000951 [Rickettsiaceae bacterium]
MKYIVSFLFFIAVTFSCNFVLAVDDSLPLSASSEQTAEAHKIKIAAGGFLDDYYMIGLRLCSYMSSATGKRCELVPTSGSLENIKLLQNNEVDFAFATSTLAADVYNGTGQFDQEAPDEDLVQLLNLHDLYFTALAKDNDNIKTFQDLDGKNISNGPPSSDSTDIYKQIFALYKFKQEPTDIESLYENYATQYCSGTIDALMILTGHPNSLVNMIAHKCQSGFIAMDSSKIDSLTKNNKLFFKATLKKGSYPGITRDTDTVATKAIFITRQSKHPQITTSFLNHVRGRLEQLKLSNEVLNKLSTQDFTSNFVLPEFNNESMCQ